MVPTLPTAKIGLNQDGCGSEVTRRLERPSYQNAGRRMCVRHVGKHAKAGDLRKNRLFLYLTPRFLVEWFRMSH